MKHREEIDTAPHFFLPFALLFEAEPPLDDTLTDLELCPEAALLPLPLTMSNGLFCKTKQSARLSRERKIHGLP